MLVLVFYLLWTFVGQSLAFNNFTDEIESTIKGNDENLKKTLFESITHFMDRDENPCQDFYKYACGNFGKYNHVYENARLLRMLDIAAYHLKTAQNRTLSKIMEIMDKNPSDKNKDFLKLSKYYGSCMNIKKVQTTGKKELLKLIESLETGTAFNPKWNNTDVSALVLLGKLRRIGFEDLISIEVAPDYTNLTQNILTFSEPWNSFLRGHFNDFYGVRSDIIEKVAYVIRSLLRSNPKLRKIKNEIVKFEAAYRKITTRHENRTRSWKNFQKLNINELVVQIPGIDWVGFLSALRDKDLDLSEDIILFDRSYFEKLAVFLENQEIETVVNRIMINFANEFMLYAGMDSQFDDTSWWETCVKTASKYMDEPLSELFYKEYLNDLHKSEAIKIAEHLRGTFEEKIKLADWVEKANKKDLIEKLTKMDMRSFGIPKYYFGHNKSQEIFRGIKITRGDFFTNTLNLIKFDVQKYLLQIGTPVRAGDLDGGALELNGENNIIQNKITISVGYLKPPFFESRYPEFYKYAVLGYTIGHEIFHGFDNIGSEFRPTDELNGIPLYTNKTAQRFNRITKCYKNEYRRAGLKAKVVLHELLADNIGLKLAYDGYMDLMKERPMETVPGLNLTSSQLFFLSFAQHKCTESFNGITNENSTIPHPYGNIADYNIDRNEPHPPEVIRILATLRLSEEFAESFKCAPNSKMNAEDKCKLFD